MLKSNIKNREHDKFVESSTRSGKSAIEVALGSVDANSNQETITLIDTSNSNYVFIGSALPSSLSSDSAWRIQRVDLTGNEIKILFADSNQGFNNIWDNRASLIYG